MAEYTYSITAKSESEFSSIKDKVNSLPQTVLAQVEKAYSYKDTVFMQLSENYAETHKVFVPDNPIWIKTEKTTENKTYYSFYYPSIVIQVLTRAEKIEIVFAS